MPWPQTGATQYHVQLGLPDKGRAMTELAVCNYWGLLNGLTLGFINRLLRYAFKKRFPELEIYFI